MISDQSGDLVKNQSVMLQSPESLLQISSAVCNDTDYLLHEAVIRCDLAIPAVDKISHNDGDDSV